MPRIIELNDLSALRRFSADFSQLGNDYTISRLSLHSAHMNMLDEAFRLSGLSVLLVTGGNLNIEINSQSYTLDPQSLLVLTSSAVVKITDIDHNNLDGYVINVSPSFLNDLNIDLNSINLQQMVRTKPSPSMHLTADEHRIMREYMDLLFHNASLYTENTFSRNTARSLIQAMLYQIMQFATSNSRSLVDSADQPTGGRRINYVHDFMHLVQVHHCTERSLDFYARKLFISSKYLSRIIKESTGRSAADWIDQFVILEAKNMLRFSNKNIQQIAYALNFSTQSSFGKFFKHITGMSPSQYQKS